MRCLDRDEDDDPLLSVVNLINVLVVIGIVLIVIVQNPLNRFSLENVGVVEDLGEATCA